MKKLHSGVAGLLCAFLSGCELLCQGGSMTCGMSREQAERLLHPKSYGQFWIKSGITQDEWRADWVACGGLIDGSYSAGPRLPGETGDIAASDRKAKQLDTCMRSKGYEFKRE